MGLWLGGGRGLLTTRYGLAIDSLLEIEFVDGSGSLRVANKEIDTDLFWAARGAGGEFVSDE